jgi:hypothetical protein
MSEIEKKIEEAFQKYVNNQTGSFDEADYKAGYLAGIEMIKEETLRFIKTYCDDYPALSIKDFIEKIY